jgi:hypothetical protein
MSNLLIHKWDYKPNHWIQNLHIQKSLIETLAKIKQGTMNSKAQLNSFNVGQVLLMFGFKISLAKKWTLP